MENFDYKEACQFSAYYGLKVALLWSGSFLCWAYSLDYVLLGPLSLLLGIGSIALMGMILRGYNNEVASLNLFRSTWMAWQTFFFAGLVTTMSQYLYFQFLDHGHLANGMEQSMLMPENEALMQALLHEPQYTSIFQQMFPEEDVSQWGVSDLARTMSDAMRSISSRDIAMEMLILNFIIGTIAAFPCGIFGLIAKSKKQ